MVPVLVVGSASLLVLVGLVLAIIRWLLSEYRGPGLAAAASGPSVPPQPRPAEPWWEAQQRSLSKQAAAAAAAERGAGGGARGAGRQQQQEGEQQRARGGLAGGDPLAAMAAGGSHCRVCQAATTTRCSKCKAVSYCSTNCQRQDWNRGHKYECQRLQNQASVAAANRMAAAKGKLAKQTAAQAAAAAAARPPGGGAAAAPQEPQEEAPVPRQVIFPYAAFLRLVAGGAGRGRRSGPRGLANVGNSCYANATMQCLLATRPLRAFLDAGVHSAGCRKPPCAWCLLCELQELTARVADEGGEPLSVRQLLRNIRQVAKGMAYGRQEDTHELFYSVLNAVECIQLLEAGGKDAYDIRSRETTLINHVYGGYVRQQITCCSCGAASRRFFGFMDVVLDIPPGTAELEDALALHTQEEELDDGATSYQCDACSSRTRAFKSVKFEVAPNCLVLCLKRFGLGRFSKINRRVAAGEALNLGPFMADGAMDAGPYGYSLYAVIVHLDHMNSTTYGHYVAYVRAGDGRWYLCDDDSVVPVSLGKVLSANAYMLFYERDQPKPAPDPSYLRPGAAGAAGRAAPAAGACFFDAVASPPPSGLGLPAAASVPAPRPPRRAATEGATPAGAAAVAAAAAAAAAGGPPAGAPPPPRPPAPPLPYGDVSSAPEPAPAGAPPPPPAAAAAAAPSPAEQLRERLSRVSTAPAALVRMGGAADAEESARSPSTSSSDGEAIAAAVGAAPPAARESWSGGGGSGGGGSGSGGGAARRGEGVLMPPASELLAAARAQAEAAARAAGAAAPPAAAAPPPQPHLPSPFADALAAAAAAGGGPPPPAPRPPAVPAVAHSLRLEGGCVVLRAALPGVASSRDVGVTLLPDLLQVSVPGRFQLLEIDLPPALTGGRPVDSVSVKLFKRSGTLKVAVALGGSGGSGSGSDGAARERAEARRARRRAARWRAAEEPVVVDWWSSEAGSRDGSSLGGESSAASSAGPGTPRRGGRYGRGAGSGAGFGGGESASDAPSDGECIFAGGAARGALAAAAASGALSPLSSSLQLHTSMSTGDLFALGLHQTARAEHVLRRLSQAAPLPGASSSGGGAGGGD
ncbi:MAG: hypothetical protein J3K34DRAFT_517344 [Monoraphidium minutum]|nr:MAG: hypothetical protein J3K34DRAFT_517344 [Monoraphidium minutum]